MNRGYLYEQWLNSQIIKAGKKRKYPKRFIGERGYPHLDNKVFYPKIGNNQEQSAVLADIVTEPENLRSHPFMPFIRNDKRQRKYREPPHDYVYSSARGDRDQKKFPHIKSRPIMYASHKDACIFSFFSYQLEQLYEAELNIRNLSNNVIAYRSIDGQNNIDFAKAAFQELQKRDEYECLMVDVKSFFDTIDHHLLAEQWSGLLPGGFTHYPDHELIFERITSYRYLILNDAVQALRKAGRKYEFKDMGCLKLCTLDDYNKYLKKLVLKNNSGVGIPQGSPISGMLANIYLIDFDESMRRLVVEGMNGTYQRYSDDLLIICPVGRSKEVYQNIQSLLSNISLKLGIKKTEVFRKVQDTEGIVNITNELEGEGNGSRKEVQYLGFHFNGKNIILRPSTLARHIRRTSKASYMNNAYKKTRDKRLAGQVNKVRRIIKVKTKNAD